MPKITSHTTSDVGYRYPGATPFSIEQQHIFFGRKQDIADLSRLIRREEMVVLYGKSGLGKSSLLNAGIIPVFAAESGYAPLLIRFRAWTEGRSDTPLSITKDAIRQLNSAGSFLHDLMPEEDSLWFHAKNIQLSLGLHPMLLFDQFEELFSFPEEQINAFQQELAESLHTGLPLRWRRLLDTTLAANVSDLQEDMLESPMNTRILFAIRADRLHLLNRLANNFPNILRHSFELHALQLDDAREAIVLPAAHTGSFKTQPFRYSDAALEQLLSFLQDPQDGRVEGILLQMLCESYERNQVELLGNHFLDMVHIGDPNEVVRNYYEEKIRSLPNEERAAAQKLIEEGLVSDGDAFRLSLHEAYIAQKFNVGKKLLDTLVDSRLLRSELFLRGGYTYELSHDRLIPAVLAARNKSRAAEATAEAQRLKMEADKARRQFRTVRFLLIASLLALAFAVFQFQAAQKAELKTRQLYQLTEQQLITLKQAEYNRLMAEGRQLRGDGRYQDAQKVFQDAVASITGFEELIDSAGVSAKAEIELTVTMSERYSEFDRLLSLGDKQRGQGIRYYPQALDFYRQALSLNVDNERAMVIIREINLEIDQAFIKYRELGDLFLREGDSIMACQNLRLAQKLKPNQLTIDRSILKKCQ